MRSYAGQKITAALLVAALAVTAVSSPVSMAKGNAAAKETVMTEEVRTKETEEPITETEEVTFRELETEEETEEERTELLESNLHEDSKNDMEENCTESAIDTDSTVRLPDTEKQGNAEPVTEDLEEEEMQTETDTQEVRETEADVRAASDYTQNDAVAWVREQSGKGLDYDGRYGVQCVDLILYYYKYLVGYTVSGSATDYITNALPAGWTRISYYDGFVAQPGDVAVWRGFGSGDYQYGHIGIVMSADANGFVSAEQNYKGSNEACKTDLWRGSYTMSPYGKIACVIRPDFKASIPSDRGGYWEEGYYPVIPDGDYHIVSSVGDQWWLTNAGFDMNDGGNVQLWQYDDMECEDHLYHFEFIPDGKGIGRGFYKITNKLSGKCLDSEGSNEWLYNQSTGKRTNVQQWTDYNDSGQQWAVNEIAAGDQGMLYTFQARCSGYYIDIEEGKIESGTNISMWEGNGCAAQQWRLIPWAPTVGRTIDDGTYQLAPYAAEEKVLSASGNNPQKGANIELNAYKGDYRHVFDVRYLGNGYYSIINQYSGASLDVADASRRLGTNIQLWEYAEGKDAQKWIIKSCGDGYYNVVSKCNGLYLDLEGGGVADGTNISLWKWEDENTNQKWKFIPYELPKEEESSSAAEESAPTEEGSTSPESESETVPPDTFEDEDPQDGVKWHYNEQKVIYKDLSIHGEIATVIKPKTYDGTPYKPAIKVTAVENGKTVTLTEGPDYRVLYFNNIHAGIATVMVRGNGIYKGTISRKFEIKKKSCKKLKVIADSMPAGDTSTPKVYVCDGAVLLKENKDYTLDGITPNLTAAKGKKQIYVVVAPNSDYEGIITVKFTVYDAGSSRIQGIINSPKAVKLSQTVYPYTGTACKPTATVTVNGQILMAGKDYTITYQNNKETGTAFAVITGKGSYTGRVVKEFTIKPSDGEFVLKKPIAATTYNGRLQKPKLTITVNGKTLKPNKDYTLAFTDNLFATDRAKVTVRGKGNYADIPAKTFYFTINPCHIKKASVKGRQGSLIITHAKHNLVEGEDYSVVYGSTVGKHKITVTIKAKEGSSFTGEVIKKIDKK